MNHANKQYKSASRALLSVFTGRTDGTGWRIKQITTERSMNVSMKGVNDLHKDKRALAATLRKYQRHILGPLFVEAADAIEELLDTVEQQKAEIITLTGQQDEPCEDCRIGGENGTHKTSP